MGSGYFHFKATCFGPCFGLVSFLVTLRFSFPSPVLHSLSTAAISCDWERCEWPPIKRHRAEGKPARENLRGDAIRRHRTKSRHDDIHAALDRFSP
jgi:hypothetical protein